MEAQGNPPTGSGGEGTSDAADTGSLEIHVNPQSDEELGSLLDTVTALMWRRSRDRAGPGCAGARWPPELSEREVEIIQLFAEGENAASIAATLHLSIHTVRSHTRNARGKLRCTTIGHAIAVAILLGCVTPKPPVDRAAEARARLLALGD